MFITSSLNVFLIQLLRAREAAIWELEERQIHEKQQLAKRQLKDIFFLQRHQVKLKTTWSEVELYKLISFRMLKFLAPVTGVGTLFIHSSVRHWFVWQFRSSGVWCDVDVEVVMFRRSVCSIFKVSIGLLQTGQTALQWFWTIPPANWPYFWCDRVNICVLREKFICVFCEKYRIQKVCVFEMEYCLCVRSASGSTSSVD